MRASMSEAPPAGPRVAVVMLRLLVVAVLAASLTSPGSRATADPQPGPATRFSAMTYNVAGLSHVRPAWRWRADAVAATITRDAAGRPSVPDLVGLQELPAGAPLASVAAALPGHRKVAGKGLALFWRRDGFRHLDSGRHGYGITVRCGFRPASRGAFVWAHLRSRASAGQELLVVSTHLKASVPGHHRCGRERRDQQRELRRWLSTTLAGLDSDPAVLVLGDLNSGTAGLGPITRAWSAGERQVTLTRGGAATAGTFSGRWPDRPGKRRLLDHVLHDRARLEATGYGRRTSRRFLHRWWPTTPSDHLPVVRTLQFRTGRSR